MKHAMDKALGIWDQLLGIIQTEAGVAAVILFAGWVGTTAGLGYLLLREQKSHQATRSELVADLKEVSKSGTDALLASTAQLAEVKTLVRTHLTLVQTVLQGK